MLYTLIKIVAFKTLNWKKEGRPYAVGHITYWRNQHFGQFYKIWYT